MATRASGCVKKQVFRGQNVSVVLRCAVMRSPALAVLLGAYCQACDLGATSEYADAGSTTAGARGNEAGASAAPGAGGFHPMLTLKQPIERGAGKWVLEFGATYFEVDASHGARIISLRQAEQELLTLVGAPNYADAFGSTFWPSPQSWPWPPRRARQLGVHGQRGRERDAHLEGQPDPATSLRVTKKFSADLAREAIRLEYSMTNTGAETVQWAPWEITRMPATGLAFWPTGGAAFGDRPIATVEQLGHTWCDPAQTPGEAKVFADGAGGYLAYLLGDRLPIKQFRINRPARPPPAKPRSSCT